jgi:para-nitrobenzyl esterase
MQADCSTGVFGPSLDADSLPVQPFAAVAAGSCAGVPLLLGTNRDEPKLFVASSGREMEDSKLVSVCLSSEFRKEAVWLFPGRFGPISCMRLF